MDDGKDYRVGYGRPPLHSQFKKGKSGNPSGSRKRAPKESAHEDLSSFRQILLSEATRPIRVKENGEVTEMSQMQAVIRSLAASALKGGPMAQRTLAGLFMDVTDQHSEELQADFDAWKHYASTWREAERKLAARGLPRPDLLPHPDDLVFDDASLTVRCIGPCDDTKWIYDDLANWRELMLAAAVYGGRALMTGSGEHAKLNILYVTSLSLNRLQPPRLRWSDERHDTVMDWMELIGRRRLRSRIVELCHHLGVAPEAALALARGKGMVSPKQLCMQYVGGTWIREQGCSAQNIRKRIWADFPFDRCSPEQIQMMRREGVPVPRNY